MSTKPEKVLASLEASPKANTTMQNWKLVSELNWEGNLSESAVFLANYSINDLLSSFHQAQLLWLRYVLCGSREQADAVLALLDATEQMARVQRAAGQGGGGGLGYAISHLGGNVLSGFLNLLGRRSDTPAPAPVSAAVTSPDTAVTMSCASCRIPHGACHICDDSPPPDATSSATSSATSGATSAVACPPEVCLVVMTLAGLLKASVLLLLSGGGGGGHSPLVAETGAVLRRVHRDIHPRSHHNTQAHNTGESCLLRRTRRLCSGALTLLLSHGPPPPLARVLEAVGVSADASEGLRLLEDVEQEVLEEQEKENGCLPCLGRVARTLRIWHHLTHTPPAVVAEDSGRAKELEQVELLLGLGDDADGRGDLPGEASRTRMGTGDSCLVPPLSSPISHWLVAKLYAAQGRTEDQIEVLESLRAKLSAQLPCRCLAGRVLEEEAHVKLGRGEWAEARALLQPLVNPPSSHQPQHDMEAGDEGCLDKRSPSAQQREQYLGRPRAAIMMGISFAAEGSMTEAGRWFERVGELTAPSGSGSSGQGGHHHHHHRYSSDNHQVQVRAERYGGRKEGALMVFDLLLARGALTTGALGQTQLKTAADTLQEALVRLEEHLDGLRLELHRTEKPLQGRTSSETSGETAGRGQSSQQRTASTSPRPRDEVAKEVELTAQERLEGRLLLGAVLNARRDPFGAHMLLESVLEDVTDACSTGPTYKGVPQFTVLQAELVAHTLLQLALSWIQQGDWNKAADALSHMHKRVATFEFWYHDTLWYLHKETSQYVERQLARRSCNATGVDPFHDLGALTTGMEPV